MADLRGRASQARTSAFPMIVTGIAALLALVALTQPAWAFQTDRGGGDIDKDLWTWTARVEEEWRNGALATTTITPYSSPAFNDFRMRDAASTTYLVGAAYALLLVVLGGLQFGLQRGRFPRNAVRGAHLAAFVLGIGALAYAVLAIPPAAQVDIDPAVTAFWGQATAGTDVLSWGPGLGWWLWAVSTALALVGFTLPIVRQRGWARQMPAE